MTELTRANIEALATRLHDEQYGQRHCDRKYLRSCPRYASAILDAGRRIREGRAEQTGVMVSIEDQEIIDHNRARYAELQKLRRGEPNTYHQTRYR